MPFCDCRFAIAHFSTAQIDNQHELVHCYREVELTFILCHLCNLWISQIIQAAGAR